MSSELPFVSLIVATVDRTAEPEALLQSLATLPRRDFEVILADQNRDDRLAPLVLRYAPLFPIRRLLVPERNACLARNAGAAAAAAPWIGFPDDDCRYRADTLETLRLIVAGHAVSLVTGQVLDDEGRSIIVGGPKPVPLTLANCWSRIAESCLFMERARFVEMGGFDRAFGPGGRFHTAEGLELVLRFLESARPRGGRFNPALVCLHPLKSNPQADDALPRAFRMGLGIGAAARRHPRPLSLVLVGGLMVRTLVRAAGSKGQQRRCELGQLRGLWAGLAHART